MHFFHDLTVKLSQTTPTCIIIRNWRYLHASLLNLTNEYALGILPVALGITVRLHPFTVYVYYNWWHLCMRQHTLCFTSRANGLSLCMVDNLTELYCVTSEIWPLMYACLTLKVLNGLWSVVLSSGLKYMSEVTYTCRYRLFFSGKLWQITRIKISYLIYINLLSVPEVRPIDICNTKYVRYGHV